MAGADYFPLDDRPFRLRMGLRPLDLAEWLEPDEHREADLALKRRLVLERYSDVVAIVDRPDVHAACDELWSLLGDAPRSPTRASDGSQRLDGLEGLHPIVQCALATQEDWVVMVPVAGELVLAAACVCFPTRWVLASKIGKTMVGVHEHVASYDEHLSSPVDSFLERLTVDKPVWRLNWNLMDDPGLFQPVAGGSHGNPRIGVGDVGERIWLRVERQTLRRLPESGAVVFGIRIHQRPISSLADRPDQLATLRTAIANLPDATFDYKGLAGFADALDEWIGERLGDRSGQKSRSTLDSMPRSSS